LQILGEIAVKVGAPMLAKLLEARVRPRPASRYARQRPNNPGWASPEMVKGWIRAMADMGEDKFVGSGSRSLLAQPTSSRRRATSRQIPRIRTIRSIGTGTLMSKRWCASI
jgi:hypothetical protein